MIKDFTPEMIKLACSFSCYESLNEFESRIDAVQNMDDDRGSVFKEGFELALKANGRDIWRYNCGNDYVYFIDDGNFVDWLKVLSVMKS